MAEAKPALTVHLTAGQQPLVFALPVDAAPALGERLPELVRTGAVETIGTSDDGAVTINFAQVAVAYIDDLNRRNKVFGLH